MKAALTVSFIRNLPFEIKKPLLAYDVKLKGFGVKINKTTKTFFVEKRIDRKLTRIALGVFPNMTLEFARKNALQVLSELAKGTDPRKRREDRKQAKRICLGLAIEDFFITRKNLAPSTVHRMNCIFNKHLADWHALPILFITSAMVLERHQWITKTAGPYAANQAMVHLQTVLNVAKVLYKDRVAFTGWRNPVRIMSEVKAWNDRKRRTRVIPKERLGEWVNTALQVRANANHQTAVVSCDFLLFLLMTGLRREEAARLTWREVYRNDGCLILQGDRTKNKQPHRLPFSDYVRELIGKRWRERVNEYVFPGHPHHGQLGCLRDLMGTIRRVSQMRGIFFSCHDLRKTFCSVAEYLNINEITNKKLLNHKNDKDVTGGYISKNFDADRLQEPIQRIADFILEQADLRRTNRKLITIRIDQALFAKIKEQDHRKGRGIPNQVEFLLSDILN